uniref:Uncharacterized protein n=1 Tax=Rhizophora mucronata TaxID=61149 RepID=A0A2P2N4S0_RHIMU
MQLARSSNPAVLVLSCSIKNAFNI